MATLLEYFNNDFNRDLSLDKTITMTFQNQRNGSVINQWNIDVIQRIRQNGDSSVRMFTYYIPTTNSTLAVIGTLLDQIEKNAEDADGVRVMGGFIDDIQVGDHRSIYSNRVYFYVENLLTTEEVESLNLYCRQRSLFVTVRSTDYIIKKMEIEKPLAFISHDSRDKDLIARRLSNGLSSRLCYVWYDEFSLKIGDSLRESIESGIKDAKKCILVLTKNYLTNPGWGKREFNSIFTREMITNERIVLPIWYGVTKEEVYDYSPSLVDTFALIWPDPANKDEEAYKQEVEQLISKIHTALTT